MIYKGKLLGPGLDAANKDEFPDTSSKVKYIDLRGQGELDFPII